MARLIWLHEDCLRAGHNLSVGHEDAMPIFVWDDAYMAAMHYGLKRRVFIYETLCELPVEIYVGDLGATLAALAEQAAADEIITGKTPNPALKEIMHGLRGRIKVTAIADAPFVQMDSPPELKRFFKYWNKARKTAFMPDGRG